MQKCYDVLSEVSITDKNAFPTMNFLNLENGTVDITEDEFPYFQA